MTNLSQLLRSMRPTLTGTDYVYVTVVDPVMLGRLNAISTFMEKEGITAICPKSAAESAALPFEETYRQIILEVHSSLQAVGLLAAVSTTLAGDGIPCNVVSACYHDHIFVPSRLAARAMVLLKTLMNQKESPHQPPAERPRVSSNPPSGALHS